MARRSPRIKRPSMNDVARLAGVSRTTVSFVLNDAPQANIPQETRDRIMQAVKQLGYRPNAMARGLRSQQSHTIGLISDEIMTTPHAWKIIQGAQEAAWAHQKLLLLVNTEKDPEIERIAIDLMLERQVEGILYATMYHHIATVPQGLQEVPTVLVDCFARDQSLPAVVPDEVEGGRIATEALLKKGHRRIGLINNSDPIPATFGRLEGYKQALAAYEIEFTETLVVSVKSSAAGGREGCQRLMQLPEPPTAMFCFTDFIAMGAYQMLQQLGRAIPDDVAIIGFDDHELIAPALLPALSTIALPHYEMGKWGVEHLLELMAPPELANTQTPVQHKLPCQFVERQSV